MDLNPHEESREQPFEMLAPVPVVTRFTTEDARVAGVETSTSSDAPKMPIDAEFSTSSAPPPAATETAGLPAALEGSGLVMVETSPTQVQFWEAQNPLETAPTPRRRRTTPPQSQDDEPLVQIETGK
jgi:hypothetical protein